MTSYFRVHPAINFGRVGDSEEFYIAPETAAGKIVDPVSGLFGGLPIKAGTEDTPISAEDFRDDEHKVKRQAARFRIYAYNTPQQTYPSNDPGREVGVGDSIDGKTIRDIVWTVHLANKKNNNYLISNGQGGEDGVESYENGQTPPLRNASFGHELGSDERRRQLVIDPGPRALSCQSRPRVDFDTRSPVSYANRDGSIHTAANYPRSFPEYHFANVYPELGPINSLGHAEIESGSSRLLVCGGYGKAFAFADKQGRKPSLDNAIDNDGWFDDVSDGPVNATVLFDDGSNAEVVAGWFVCTDPSYAPQTRNVVSCWDDILDTWVANLDLMPQLFQAGEYNPEFTASFESDVLPIFHGAFLQRWNTNLPNKGIHGHDWLKAIKPNDNPSEKIPHFESLIRNPNISDEDDIGVKMPLALGDAKRSFLSLSKTQYFLLMQWYRGRCGEAPHKLGGGEELDMVVLENCLGGRYSPGIDLTFIVRDIHLYEQNWQGQTGPFRIAQGILNYAEARADQPLLGVGYVPLRSTPAEPGDLSKFMSQPWHTDYNSCAVHEPDPNPAGNNTLYWSWPAQRPVQVHPVDLCQYDAATKSWNLGSQRFSIRGDNATADNLTHTDLPQNVGKYQHYIDFMYHWHKTGFIIQGVQIPADLGGHYGNDKFLEVASRYSAEGDTVQPWPTSSLR